MVIISDSFEDGEEIPTKHTCQGEDINPSLMVDGAPGGTKSLALIADDPDAPMGTWTHWTAWNIEPDAKIAEKSHPGTSGTNDFGKIGYGGPCPPSGTHRYYFKVYALDTLLGLGKGASREDLESAMKGHILETAVIMGRYRRK